MKIYLKEDKVFGVKYHKIVKGVEINEDLGIYEITFDRWNVNKDGKVCLVKDIALAKLEYIIEVPGILKRYPVQEKLPVVNIEVLEEVKDESKQ